MFKNRIAPKERKAGKAFVAPTKEQATTGLFLHAGDNYGSGYTQPVGTHKASSKGPIPMQCQCFSVDEMGI